MYPQNFAPEPRALAAEESTSESEAEDEQPLPPLPYPRALTSRPQSSMSSHRYRTPMASTLLSPPPHTMSVPPYTTPTNSGSHLRIRHAQSHARVCICGERDYPPRLRASSNAQPIHRAAAIPQCQPAPVPGPATTRRADAVARARARNVEHASAPRRTDRTHRDARKHAPPLDQLAHQPGGVAFAARAGLRARKWQPDRARGVGRRRYGHVVADSTPALEAAGAIQAVHGFHNVQRQQVPPRLSSCGGCSWTSRSSCVCLRSSRWPGEEAGYAGGRCWVL